MSWRQALTRAITEEVAAQRAAATAEEARRRTWWATTWALAAVPRANWAEAQMEYVKRTGHAPSTAKTRRRVGERLSKADLHAGLPLPRFAQVAIDWVGKDGDAAKLEEAVGLLAQAEKDDMSLREFRQALTGKSWTTAPEGLTAADEEAIVERIARTRPHLLADAWMSTRKRDGGAVRMPAPKGIPAEERPLRELDLAALLTEFSIIAADAEDVRRATDIVNQVKDVLTEDQRDSLLEQAKGAHDAWTLVMSVLLTDTDEALQAILDGAA